MSDLIEDGLKIEKDFKQKILNAISKTADEEIKIEMIYIAGIEYFNSKLKMMVKFYDENKEIEKALAQEKIDQEIENYTKRHQIEELSKKELDVMNCIIKYKTWATTALISRETKHTWVTVDKYLQRFIELGFVEVVKSDLKRMKRYQLTKDYSFMIKKEVSNGKENKS
jgi:hypothetical protein